MYRDTPLPFTVVIRLQNSLGIQPRNCSAAAAAAPLLSARFLVPAGPPPLKEARTIIGLNHRLASRLVARQAAGIEIKENSALTSLQHGMTMPVSRLGNHMWLWLALFSFCVAQHITPLCSNKMIASLATYFGIEFSSSRFASISGEWCAKADYSSLVHKLGSMLGGSGGSEYVAPTRDDWRAGIHLIILIFTVVRPVFNLRLLGSLSFASPLRFLFQYGAVVGLLVLFSNLFQDISRQDQFMIGVLCLFGFLFAVPISDQSQFIPVQKGLVCVVVVTCYFLAEKFVNIYISFIIGSFFILAVSAACIFPKLYNILFRTIEHMKHNFSVSSFLLNFLLRDIVFALRLVSTLVALFVPFNKLYEIIFDVYLSVADDLHSLQLVSLTTLVFTAVLCLALCIIALLHLFCDSMRAASAGSKQMGAEIVSGVNATKDATKHSAQTKADTEAKVAAYIFVNEMSMFLMMLNIVKVMIRRHELLLPALGLSNSLNSACSFMSLCDVLVVYVGFVRYAKHISDKKRLPWYVCPILILMGLNNVVFMPHEMVSHVGSSTSLMDLFSNCFSHDVESVSHLIWSMVLHVAPFFRFIRLIFDQFFTIFEDVSRLAPAEVLLKEFDSCYVIEFSGSHHEDARLDFSPVYGTAAIFYQPFKNRRSIGAFVMEINGSALPATVFIPELLKQPLSLCFMDANHPLSSKSEMYTVSSLVFRRFHRVQAQLSLPSPLVFNRSIVPWIRATQWKAMMYGESSLLPGRQRRKRLSCDSHNCRPVSFMQMMSTLTALCIVAADDHNNFEYSCLIVPYYVFSALPMFHSLTRSSDRHYSGIHVFAPAAMVAP